MVTPADGHKNTYNNMGCEAITQAAGTLTFRCENILNTPVDVSVEVIIFNL